MFYWLFGSFRPNRPIVSVGWVIPAERWDRTNRAKSNQMQAGNIWLSPCLGAKDDKASGGKE